MVTVTQPRREFTAFIVGAMSALGVTLSAAGVYAAEPAAMVLTSPAFVDGGEIPREFTCQGADTPPPLNWANVPTGTRSLMLVVDDPDAPDPAAPRVTWVHWLLYELPPAATGLAGGAAPLPVGTQEGLNDFERTAYGGPCPPIGRHRYFFKLYALDRSLSELDGPDKAALEAESQEHVLAKAQLIGTYQKQP